MTRAAPPLFNLFTAPAVRGPAEHEETLLARPGVTLERLVSFGHTGPEGGWYDQETDEWVMLASGAARLRIEGETGERHLAPGDCIWLPAHCRHRVTWTDPDTASVWLALHLTPGKD